MSAPAELTAVVPTHNRPQALAASLRALDAQRAEVPLEIVVVDDRSADAGEVARAVASLQGARLVTSPRPGVSAARNAGVRAARTPFVAFTDDDCEAQPGWAAALLKRLDAGVAVVAGATVDERNGTALAAASQLVANALLRARSLPTAPASNVACRRELVLEIAFDESYLGIGGEERDWYARLAARGHGFGLEPRAVVVHRKRLTLTAFWRQHVRYGRGAYRFRRIHLRGQLEPASFYAELVRSGFRRGARAGLAVCLAQLATATGFALEALAERRRRAA